MRRAATVAGLTGAAGSLACTVAMTAALAGALGSGAAAGARAATRTGPMSGMATPSPGGPAGVLIEYGPQILAASELLVTGALARRRLPAAVPAAAAGALMWWGIYAQASTTVMYLALALAYAAWTATWLWARCHSHPATKAPSGPPSRSTPSQAGYDGTLARTTDDQKDNHGDTTS